ncbi:DNA replication complex GINS protein PSF2-like [Sarcoptes scabiei]|nr:DNA replication complex GINS protein PSF2-like [Sarcoptes scabiei]
MDRIEFKHTLILSLSIAILFQSSSFIDCDSNIEIQNHIKDLRKELFQNRGYDPMTRPVRNYTHAINVSIYLDVNYIKNLDVQTKILESEGWIRLSWFDENLKWKTIEFGGIEDIRVKVDEVFRPDITLINSADSENVLKRSTHSDLILWFTGEVFWMPAISMKTLCQINLVDWPFDQQTCLYRFASWTYDGTGLNLQNMSDRVDLSSFTENSEWDPIESTCEYKMHDYDEGVFYPEVVFGLKLQRKTTIYRYAVYIPVICALLLNLMALFLDVQNKLRFHLSTLTFFTLLIIILYLGAKLGFGSLGLPKVIKYIGQMIMMTSITIIWFAFSLNFFRSSYEAPPILIRLIEPVQHLFVSKDIESVQLTENDIENPPGTIVDATLGKSSHQTNRSDSVMKVKLILIQVIDKLLFILYFMAMIFLHN